MKNLYEKILNSGYDTNDCNINNHRKKVINLTALFAIPILLIFIVVNIKSNIYILAYADSFALTAMITSFIYLNKSKKVFLACIGTIIGLYSIFLGALFSAGIANSSFFWFFVFPPLSIFFFGIKKGLYFVYALLLSIGLFYIYANSVNLELTYDTKLLIVLMLALLVVTKITTFYEGLRKHYESTIIDQKEKIEHMNKLLEQRVKEEVAKNREKDRQMLHQSRLAQMGEMISMIAHQWRQPLSAISSAASTLSFDIIMDNYKKEFFGKQLENISSYSQHLSSTIDDFRNFFKNNKEKAQTSLKEVVENTLSIIKISLDNKNITLKTDFHCNETINSYPNELKQVVLNLIKNAEDIFIEKETKDPLILIQTYKKDGYCYLRVEDNAGGIPKEIIDKIFDPYFTTKEKRDGTGLGLYMSKTIIEDHCKGKLSAFNSSKGAIFEIKIIAEVKNE